jgi:hypothetical protein
MVRATVSVVSGMAAQAVAAAQGHSLRSLLTTLTAPGSADQAETAKSEGAAAPTEEMVETGPRVARPCLAIRASRRTGMSNLRPRDLPQRGTAQRWQ